MTKYIILNENLAECGVITYKNEISVGDAILLNGNNTAEESYVKVLRILHDVDNNKICLICQEFHGMKW